MKSIIVYFSLTGNTKKIALAIHKGMNCSTMECDIAMIKKFDVNRLTEYDLIGFGSPVWGGVPANVKRLMNTMPQLTGKHAFIFCTHGALPERYFPPFVEGLQKNGLTVIGIRDWYGSVFRPALPKPYLTDGHPDVIDLTEAEDFGKDMTELSRKIYAGECQSPPLPEMGMSPPNKLPRPLPKLNREKCRYPECRLCMEHCPVDAIDLTAVPPIFARGCSICYFCEMICPEGAIEVDYEARVTASRAHFDKFLKVLAIAEKEGRFRRLVPVEKVRWDRPYFKVSNKHPRYIIPEEENAKVSKQ
jgi:flavodoxin/formate hydrogenlyase subunit 6/NADH:ubiquinone oxidoreductase subunit I